MSPPRPLPLAFSCLKHSLRKVIWIASKIKQGGEEEEKKKKKPHKPNHPANPSICYLQNSLSCFTQAVCLAWGNKCDCTRDKADAAVFEFLKHCQTCSCLIILGVVVVIMIVIPSVNILEREVLGGVETSFRSEMHRDSLCKKPKVQACPSCLEAWAEELRKT